MSASKPVATLVEEAVASGVLAGGAGEGISRAYKPDLLFLATMRQQLLFGDSEAVGVGSGGGKGEVKPSAAASKGKRGK